MLLVFGAALLTTGGLSSGCTAVQRVSGPSQHADDAYLKLAVEPSSAEVWVDGGYRGKVAGWRDGLLPLKPGERRVKLVADGYVTRRFDVELEAGESKTLTLEMERDLDDFAG